MNIEGHAFKPNEKEIRDRRKTRYEEIAHLADSLKIRKDPQYGRVNFSGVLSTDEHRKLSEEDLALIADFGDLCFGGECTKRGDTFSGRYYTD